MINRYFNLHPKTKYREHQLVPVQHSLSGYEPTFYLWQNNSLYWYFFNWLSSNIWWKNNLCLNHILRKSRNKGNAKHGVSPCLKIWPGDLDLWPRKSIGFQILLRTKYVPSLVKIHWRMLIHKDVTEGRTDGRKDGR